MLKVDTSYKDYVLPYKVNNEYGNKIIGIFGDSFAALAKDAKYNKEFSHELTWPYYLGVLSNSSVDAWGVNGGSELDLAFVLQKNKVNYDYTILVHTSPTRLHAQIKENKNNLNLYKALATIEGLTRDKKNVLHMFWNEEHEIYKFSHKKYFMRPILKYHPHPTEVGSPRSNSVVNKNDQLGSTCHLSNRGSLLLAIEINKYLFSNDASI
jgi:hypothetical protein